MTLTDVDGNDWGKLHSGKLSWDQIEEAIQDPTWQYARKTMKGKPMTSKWRLCQDYLKIKSNGALAKVAVTNYVNALKRAGLVFERVS
ncbi:MAG TPA: hypothetical protein PL124_10475 [Candidatus Cloacimonadota bacterium]|nr:hypothetical protein [Candidatus Cloacimonadota bacterium]